MCEQPLRRVRAAAGWSATKTRRRGCHRQIRGPALSNGETRRWLPHLESIDMPLGDLTPVEEVAS